jgi:hypothetical protein
VCSTVRVPLGSSGIHALLCGHFALWPLMHYLFAALPSKSSEAERPK